MPEKKTKKSTGKSSGFSAEERAAMKERARELKAEAVVAPGVLNGLGQRACHLDGLRDALDRDFARNNDGLAVEVDLVGGKAKLGIPLGVEEVRGLEVRGEVFVLDVDASDLRAALERGVGAVDDEPGRGLAELTLERTHEVGDLEADRRVDGTELPGTLERSANLSGTGHLKNLLE